jgi:hypothetical protein
MHPRKMRRSTKLALGGFSLATLVGVVSVASGLVNLSSCARTLLVPQLTEEVRRDEEKKHDTMRAEWVQADRNLEGRVQSVQVSLDAVFDTAKRAADQAALTSQAMQGLVVQVKKALDEQEKNNSKPPVRR